MREILLGIGFVVIGGMIILNLLAGLIYSFENNYPRATYCNSIAIFLLLVILLIIVSTRR